MRRHCLAAILLFAASLSSVSAAAAGPPIRVMSLNQCADQIVLALVPPARIASVTWLSRDPAGSLMTAAARRVGVNHGAAEEVVAQNPDLVVAGSFTTPATRSLLRQLGYPMIEVGSADSFADIRRITRQVAAAVGETARAELLIARMDRQLAELARDPAPRLRVAAWDGGGFDAPAGSLYDAMLTAAGAINVANEATATGYRAPDAEVLLKSAPALLVQGVAGIRHEVGPRDDVARHPVVRRIWRGRTLVITPAYYICGTPFSADAALALRDELRSAAAQARQPLDLRDAAR
ncbi:MAG: ABC transporter substrate-binding protein [Janthinobacterium lividum]